MTPRKIYARKRIKEKHMEWKQLVEASATQGKHGTKKQKNSHNSAGRRRGREKVCKKPSES